MRTGCRRRAHTGRARANLAVIRLIDELRAQERDATAAEREGVLARWSGWGACPELFDEQRDAWEPSARRTAQPGRRRGVCGRRGAPR